MTNPLLSDATLPVFDQIKSKHMLPALQDILGENAKALKVLLKAQPKQPDWLSLMQPLDQLDNRLDRVWSPIRHLNSVMDSPETREAYDHCLEALTEYQTDLGQNQELFSSLSKVYESASALKLDSAQKKALQDALLGFRLNGVALSDNDKKQFKALQQELNATQSAFEKNLLDATLGWAFSVNSDSKLQGLPESARQMAKQAAEQAGQKGWSLTLQAPSYIAAMTYLDDRSIREQIYTAYQTRASDQGPDAGRWDNSEHIERIMRLRYERAQLLGFSNYAEQSLTTKMAENPQHVLEFLRELAAKAKPKAMQEFDELKDFANSQLKAEETFSSWDSAYFSEKLRQQRYAISQEELKPWFPAEHVLNGLFNIVNQLFGIKVKAVDSAPVWHSDVRLYEIYDEGQQLRGRFFLDLYARANKRGGAWMDECLGRFALPEGLQAPSAFLTCNLTPPVGDKPALFTHDDVVTLFHEFGHGLHHMLTQVDYPSIAGIRGVEWDAVELPSQFLENWCWETDALKLISSHYETGGSLPDAMIEKLQSARHFQAPMFLMRQLELALFDLRLHLEYQPKHGSRHQQILNEVRDEVAVLKPPAYNRFQHGFSHIFAGGYAAGYYSYLWAEVLSADAFERFKQAGIFDHDSGRAFMHNILEKGGSAKAMDLFVSFRGREPKVDALLRSFGLAA